MRNVLNDLANYADARSLQIRGVMRYRCIPWKKVAAPKVVGEDMIFYQISQPEDLEPGYFGIREPKTSLPVADGEDGLMIMPGVAFDNQRHRVGYGGGFYDRYLSKHTSHFTAALAFEFQMMEEVPTEPTDLLPDVVITEKTIYR